MKKKLKLAFSDFWGGFEYSPNSNTPVGDNVFYNILSERFDIEISNNPDFLIFSVFGNNHRRYSCEKIFYTGENIRPNFEFCDYSISFDYIEDDRNIRYPLSGVTLYESNKKDLETWFLKCKSGGILAGHDYNNIYIGVKKAVDEFADKYKLNVEHEFNKKTFKNYGVGFYIIKP